MWTAAIHRRFAFGLMDLPAQGRVGPGRLVGTEAAMNHRKMWQSRPGSGYARMDPNRNRSLDRYLLIPIMTIWFV